MTNKNIEQIINKNLTLENFEIFIKNGNSDKFIEEMFKSLKEMALNNYLEKIENHNNHFINSWNQLIDDKLNVHSKNDIDYFLSNILRYNTSGDFKDKSINEIFDKFKDIFSKGDIRYSCIPSVDCRDCGVNIKIKFNNWKAGLYEYRKKDTIDKSNSKNNDIFSTLKNYDYFELTKCFDDFVKVKEVEFKTGNLIITDWIKLEEFNEIVEVNGNIFNFNINTAKGVDDSINHYLKQGFISINTVRKLDIFSTKKTEDNNLDGFVFGILNNDLDDEYQDAENKDIEHFKTISNDYRGLTIIEEEKLEEILNKKFNDINKTKEVIKKYIQSNKSDLITKKINPGTYTLVYDVQVNELSKSLFPLTLNNGIDPLILLYDKNLNASLINENNDTVKKNNTRKLK